MLLIVGGLTIAACGRSPQAVAKAPVAAPAENPAVSADAFRVEMLPEIAALGETYQELIAMQKITEDYGLLARNARAMNVSFPASAQQSWTEARIAECLFEVKLRIQVSVTEQKVKDRSNGIYPPWFTQDRGWQTADAHIRQSKFINRSANECTG